MVCVVEVNAWVELFGSICWFVHCLTWIVLIRFLRSTLAEVVILLVLFECEVWCGARSPLWSCHAHCCLMGVSCFEMLLLNTHVRQATALCWSVHVECEDLIRRLLCTDPRRRISVTEIVSHRWMRMAGDDAEFEQLMYNSLNPASEDAGPNEAVLEHMTKLGLDKDQVLAVSVCHSTTEFLVYLIHLLFYWYVYYKIRIQCR